MALQPHPVICTSQGQRDPGSPVGLDPAISDTLANKGSTLCLSPPHMARCCLWLPPVFCSRPWEGAIPEITLSSPRDQGQHRLMEPAVWYLLYQPVPKHRLAEHPNLVSTVLYIWAPLRSAGGCTSVPCFLARCHHQLPALRGGPGHHRLPPGL